MVKFHPLLFLLVYGFTAGTVAVMQAIGWVKNPMSASAKKQQFGSYKVSDATEAGATGAAEVAGIAAGILKLRS
jgi:hypothetical protein